MELEGRLWDWMNSIVRKLRNGEGNRVRLQKQLIAMDKILWKYEN